MELPAHCGSDGPEPPVPAHPHLLSPGRTPAGVRGACSFSGWLPGGAVGLHRVRMQSTAAPPLPLPSPCTPQIPCNVHICAGMGGVGSQGRRGESSWCRAEVVGGSTCVGWPSAPAQGGGSGREPGYLLVHTRDSGSRPPPWLSFSWNPIP